MLDPIQDLSQTSNEISLRRYLWSVLNLLMLFGVLFFVFSYLFGDALSDNLALHLLLGLILWSFFKELSSYDIPSTLNKHSRIRSSPHKSIYSLYGKPAVIGLVINLLIFLILFFTLGGKLSFSSIIVIVLAVCLYYLGIGARLMISALYAKSSFYLQLWQMFLVALFWFTPIVYSSSLFPERFFFLVYLNPLARIMEYSRHILLASVSPTLKQILNTILLCLLVFFIGLSLFSRYANTRSRR